MNISEAFLSIQGEGISTGVPSIFIRLQGCNLMCGGPNGSLVKEGKATWWCDSECVWKNGTLYTNPGLEEKLLNLVNADDILDGKVHLIWTGGEPTMPRNIKDIISFLNYIDYKYINLKVYNEIETNGTLVVPPEFYKNYIQQINCSPKLSNSGMSKSMRINKEAIEQIKMHPNHWFKFVISNEKDIDEIMEDFVYDCQINTDNIILMPGCDNLEDLSERTRFVWNIAVKRKWKMCSRLHILAFNKLTGV